MNNIFSLFQEKVNIIIYTVSVSDPYYESIENSFIKIGLYYISIKIIPKYERI